MRRTIIIIILTCGFLSCLNLENRPVVNQVIKTPEGTPADSVMLPGGFRIGMTEDEIRSYVKLHPEKFYTKKNQLIKYIHTRIDKEDYSIYLSLYRGKLQSVLYLGVGKWTNVTDEGLKQHYKAIYNLLNGMNKYNNVENTYLRWHKAEWPYSLGYNDAVFMNDFKFNSDLLHKGIQISLSSYVGKISVDINYDSELNETFESTLRSSVYFN